MKKYISLNVLLLVLAFVAFEAKGWGREGHTAVAYIAEMQLTERAKANIEKRIDNRSIVYYATWLDNHRRDHKEWNQRRHTCEFDIDTFRPIGKPVAHLKESIELMRQYESLTDSAFRFNLFVLLHQVGDFHCPGHNEYYVKSDKGYKKKYHSKYDVYFVERKAVCNYHGFWDTDVLRYRFGSWGYMDYGNVLAANVPEDVKKQITAGSVEDWLEDSARRSLTIYEQIPSKPKNTPKDELSVVTPGLVNGFNDLANEQILRAGLRLGALLNEIFDK